MAGSSALHGPRLRTGGPLQSRKPDLRGEELFYDSCWDKSPEYFVVTDMADFQEQADIKEFLLREFPILPETEDYMIFDLRQIDAVGQQDSFTNELR